MGVNVRRNLKKRVGGTLGNPTLRILDHSTSLGVSKGIKPEAESETILPTVTLAHQTILSKIPN